MNNITYKKQHKIKLSLITNKTSSTVKYGTYAIKAVNAGILTAKQVESSRRVISKETKRTGRVFIRVFFNLSKTKKPLLSRMGKGCGVIKN
jgi:large subunit ribosomal protein L16